MMSSENQGITRCPIKTLTTVTLDTHVLDLSDCWSDSANLKALIQSCHNLYELCVINCSLKLDHLLDVLGDLRELKELSVTISGAHKDLRLELYPSIENINIEFRPDTERIRFVVALLKACPAATHLHAMIVGKLPKRQVTADELECGGESLSKYERAIISTDKRTQWTFFKAFALIFAKESSVNHYEPNRSRSGGVFWYERRSSLRGPIKDGPESGSLNSLYRQLDLALNEIPDTLRQERMNAMQIRAHYQGQGIVMPRLEALSAVVELDFTQCHLVYSAESWRALARSSPVVESLAIPSCALSGDTSARQLSSTSADIMRALANLKLRRLYVASSPADCPNCSREITGVFMEHLSGIQSLEELTVYEVCVSDDFFDRIREPLAVKTFKLAVLHLPDLNGLERLLKLCKSLQNLKLEATRLRFDCEQLWHAVSAVNLKQLCLSSSGTMLIKPRTLRLHLSRLFESLNVLHLHASHVWGCKEVQTVLEEEACTANRARKFSPVRSVLVEDASMTGSENVHTLKFPGRSLCSMRSFIGEPKPVGWNCD